MEQNKILRKIEDGREYRKMSVEVRAVEGGDTMTVTGYATTFNQPYVLWEEEGYKVVEQVAPTAFNECDMSDVIMQYDHAGRVFARNKNGTLNLQIDEIGLKITADLGGTDIGRQLYQEIKGGYTDKMSFGFVVENDRQEYISENGSETVLRTILKIKKLYDVSAVSLPANDMTSISARNFANGAIERNKAERLKRAQKIKKIKLLLEV